MSKFLISRYIMFTFRNGNFSVRRTKSFFNKVASDQCIEQSVNREQKCRGGISGFSKSEGAVQRWTLTNHRVAQCVAIFRNNLRCSKTNRKPKELGKSRIEFSKKSADRAYDVLKQWGNLFDERDSLNNICLGKEATPAIRGDITNALKIRENALDTFWKDRLK